MHRPLHVVGGRRVDQAQDPHLPSFLGTILGIFLGTILGSLLGNLLGRIRIKTAMCGGFSSVRLSCELSIPATTVIIRSCNSVYLTLHCLL